MRQVSITTIGLIRSTSSSDLGCRWFTSLLDDSVSGWWLKALYSSTGLIEPDRDVPFHTKAKTAILASRQGAKERACVCVSALLYVRAYTWLSLLPCCQCSLPFLSARYWLVSQPICLLVPYLWYHSSEIPRLIPDGAADVLSLFSIRGTWDCHVPCAWNWAARTSTVEHLMLCCEGVTKRTLLGWLHVS